MFQESKLDECNDLKKNKRHQQERKTSAKKQTKINE